MKKLVLTLAVILLALNFSFANKDKPKDDIIVKKADGIEIVVKKDYIQNSSDDFAVHCKAKCANGNTYSCWFCDCSELPSCGDAQQK